MLAEISDKMPAVLGIWIWSVGLAAVVVGCRRLSRWSFLATIPLAGWLAFAIWKEFLADIPIREAIIAELGYGYLIQMACAGLVPLVAVLASSAYDLHHFMAEPCTPPNGGPTTPPGHPMTAEGPPSVS